MKLNDDLSLCEQEPIHIPGMIQPHGFCCSFCIETKLITSVSENIPDAKTLLGKPVSTIVPQNILEDLSIRIESDEHEDIIYDINIPYLGDGKFDIAQMDPDGEMIIEIYPRPEGSDYHECNFKLAHSVSKLMPNQPIIDMCEFAAKEIRKLSGFDRVMLYRFDEDYNGSVIAEEKAKSVKNSYLGLHFPADDIPKQARELYRKQTVRIISDVDYKAVDLIRLDKLKPLDMTFSQLRSVSPIHIEYLKNMNVNATLTVSIIVNDQLWGLIACHNYSAKYMSLRNLELIRTFGIFFSGMIEANIESHSEQRNIELRSILDTIIQSMQLTHQSTDFNHMIQHNSGMFASLLESDGFAFMMDELIICESDKVDNYEIKFIVNTLKPSVQNGIYSTSNLSKDFPELGEDILTNYSGVILVEIQCKTPTYWLWFRKEKRQTLDWGGDPNNRMTINEDGRIQPRQSFEKFTEIVRYRSERWDRTDRLFMSNFIKTMESFFEWFKSTREVSLKEKQIQDMEDERVVHYQQLLESLVDMIEQRDAYTAGHTTRVATYSELIAKELNLSEDELTKLYEASILHDIGKLVVPDSVLLKPGKLSESEFEIIKQHLDAGYAILNKVDYYKPLAEIIRYHHEKCDGSGYLGFKKDDIPISSHILMIADAIDAMTSNRIYQARKTMDEAIKEITDLSDKWYHPDVVKAAQKALKSFNSVEGISQIPKTAMEKARFSYHFKDQLTGVYNELYLNMIIKELIPDVNYKNYVLVSTLGMSFYNAKHGWHSGDEILCSISEQLSSYINSEHIFRIMGDDFVIACKSDEKCISLAQSIDISAPDEIKFRIEILNKERILKLLSDQD